ncbi:(2Fe-2S)-binding protein [Roseibium aquae]|uniref:(2Fe-2S)-binding protein n=1 Tax=Roseibium aquae TaxID=1323746 RepID=A0A916X0Q5_9HYPH|nr:(2Fe-2S)-binding protein [Roseibium aquae]GGB49364.1 (2Fe-2S)-binding protein [Roseibium aquae]
MLVCSCNVISKRDIEEVVRSFLAVDPWQLITPGKVYHALQKRGRCCGCFPNLINIIVAEIENHHRQAETPEADILPFLAQLRSEYERTQDLRKQAVSRRRALAS